MNNHWSKLAGVAGALAVGIGAVGAHGIKFKGEEFKEVFKTASFYHFIHACMMGVSAYVFSGRKRNIVCGLFGTGILLFSGSCYAVAIMGQRKPYGSPAPFGGTLFILGWLAFGFM